jgi:hypothetical protein
VASVYLADYVQELKSAGAGAFKQRHASPVLIVTGRAAELVAGQRSLRESTMIAAPSGAHAQALALMHRVFAIAKSPYSPPGPVSLGRTADNDVAIPEYSISKRHCFFELQQNEVSVFDCGSTNGTLLNGRRLDPNTKTALAGGDVITLGRYAFLYQPVDGFVDYVTRLLPAK